MKGYVPMNLKLDNERHLDKYYYIITHLYYRRVFDKRIEDDSFVPLYSKILIKILGGRYKEYLQFLLDKGIIETNNHYINGKQSKGYRFCKKYAKVKYKQVFITDKNIIRKIKMFKKEKEKGISSEQHRYIYKCLQKLSIKYDEAKYFIENNITNIDQYIYYNISLDLIASKNFFFCVDNTAGRIHNNVTNLSRDLRKFLRYNDEKLIEIDIANSQPFLFNILIYDYFKDHNITNISYDGNIDINVSYPYGNQNQTSSADVEKFKELTSQGLFYEYLMNEFDIAEDRSTFKVRFFSKVFFSEEKPYFINSERQQFKELFPNVYKIVAYYKREDYRNLAIALQKVEADIIINHVVPKLAKKRIYVLTIHDSILTLPDNAEIVKQTILEVFENKYGLVPTVKVKKHE